MKKILILLFIPLLFSACGSKKTTTEPFPYAQVEYRYRSIAGIELAGINFIDMKSSANPMTAGKIAAAMLGRTIPVRLTTNLNIRNPNTKDALLDGFQYILLVNNTQVSSGQVNQALGIPAGEMSVLPLSMAFDLKKSLNGKSPDAIRQMAFDLAGLGVQPANITIKIRSRMIIDGRVSPTSRYIPVSFSLGFVN